SPYYVPGPEEPEQAPPLPEFILEPVYLEFMPPEDEILPAEEQPLHAADSPTADSSRYIPESDPEEDPEEDEEDHDEDPTDYPADRDDDDDDDDEDEESSRDEADDVEEDEDEEEEHPAPTDSIPPPPVHHVTAKMSIKDQPQAEIDKLLTIPSPPPSPLSPADVPEVTLPPRKRLCITLGPRYEVGESSSTAAARPTGGFKMDYGFVATLNDEIRRGPERESVDQRGVNMLYRDRRDHARTARPMETEARLLHQAWVQSMDANDLAHSEVMALRTQVVAHHSEIIEFRAADHRRQAQFIEALKLLNYRPRCQQFRDSRDQLKVLHCSMHQRRPKIAPKRTTRSTPATTTTTTTTTTSVTDAQLKTLIGQGIANALAARDADRSPNGEDGHDFGMGNRTVFCISNCIVENQIKFATCTLLRSALTWWNSHVTTVGPDVAYAMTWKNLRKKMTDKYYPRGKIKKLEGELWNLRVKSNGMVGYNQHFQELTLSCVRMFPEESDKVKRYVDGLPDVIHESIVASRPKTMQEAIEMATKLMDKKNNTFAERQTENKQKFDDTSKNNQNQQQQNKRQNTGMAYTTGSGDKKPYGGFKPLCPKCNNHHDGQCAPKCHKYNRVGHLARDCRSVASANTANN
nr:reverse transcriptase domain-containing protein [Tanacetum cinerariifolium]